MAKLFREHRGGLEESLSTTMECPNGIADIVAHYNNNKLMRDYIVSISIDDELIPDNRLPDKWGGVSFNVRARCVDGNIVCLGQSNFRET
jgi:hypothetical protein